MACRQLWAVIGIEKMRVHVLSGGNVRKSPILVLVFEHKRFRNFQWSEEAFLSELDNFRTVG